MVSPQCNSASSTMARRSGVRYTYTSPADMLVAKLLVLSTIPVEAVRIRRVWTRLIT